MRWLKRSDNHILKPDQSKIKDLLYNVADSYSEEEYENAIQLLKDHYLWEKYPKLRTYFETHWEPKFQVTILKSISGIIPEECVFL